MWVKLSSELYAQDLMELQRRGFVRGKYYKVVDRCNYDGYATYTVIDLINRDRIFAPIGVDFFEKPVAHVECIDNEGKEDRLTLLKTYEILDMGYTFGELWIRIKQDNDEMGKYPLKRFVLVASNVIPISEIAEPLEPCKEEDNEGNDDMSAVIGCVLGFGLGIFIVIGLFKFLKDKIDIG